MSIREELDAIGRELAAVRKHQDAGQLSDDERETFLLYIEPRLSLAKARVRTEDMLKFVRSVEDDLDRL